MLEIEATGERAVPVITSVIIVIPEIEIVNPIFSRPFYSGSYRKDKGLVFTEEITLQSGYDSSVLFSLEGGNNHVLSVFSYQLCFFITFFFVVEHSQWFTLQQNENLIALISNQVNPLPQDILDQHSNLMFAIVASKPNTIDGQAAIHIDLPKGKILTIFTMVTIKILF